MNNELNIPVADVLMLVLFQAMVIQKVGDQLYNNTYDTGGDTLYDIVTIV